MNLFEIPYLKLSCSNWKQKKKKLDKLTKNQKLSRQEHNIFSTTRNIDFEGREDYVNEFTNIFKEEFQKFGNEFNYRKLNIKDIWTVVYNQHDYQTPHHHGTMGWSGILYYEYTQEQPSTIFMQPWHDLKTGATKLRGLETKEGDMVFFPSFIVHFCPSNHLKKKRKIISWDLTGEPI